MNVGAMNVTGFLCFRILETSFDIFPINNFPDVLDIVGTNILVLHENKTQENNRIIMMNMIKYIILS